MKANATIEESFRTCVAQLERLRRPAAALLQPGLSRRGIANVEARLPFRLARELVALYRMTNGTRVKRDAVLDDLHFFPGYYLLSLEDAASEYRQMRGAPQWKNGWFPFFANDAGDYYLVSCNPPSRGVIGFLRGEPEQPVEYASVGAMFRTLAECFAKGAFFVKRGDFTIDDEKHRRIAMKLNAGVAFWSEEAEEEAEAARYAEADRMAREATKVIRTKPFEALALFEKAVDLSDHPQWVYVNALFAVNLASEKRRVDPARIRRMLEICLAGRPHPDAHLNAAECWMALGETDKCIASLRKAKSKGVALKKHLTGRIYAPLAEDRRFIALKKASERGRPT